MANLAIVIFLDRYSKRVKQEKNNKMNSKGKVVIYCSSYKDIDPKYNEIARKLIQALVAEGYEIVSGGTIKGTMGVISDEVVKCGGWHRGILPKFMKGLEYKGVDEMIWTDTMAKRKELMRKDTVAAIALPGGIGTLDELIETLTLVKLKQYSGKILILNYDGFYEPLKELLDYYVEKSMFDQESREKAHFPVEVNDLINILEQ